MHLRSSDRVSHKALPYTYRWPKEFESIHRLGGSRINRYTAKQYWV